MTTEQADFESNVVGDLDENVAGALTYVFGFITGLIFYLIEEENEFVRFHAAQSILVFGGLALLGFALSAIQVTLDFIPFVGWIFALGAGLFSALLAPLAFVLWIVLIVKAYQGDRFELPVLGGIAADYV
jgi:uncharacterized membrane protein